MPPKRMEMWNTPNVTVEQIEVLFKMLATREVDEPCGTRNCKGEQTLAQRLAGSDESLGERYHLRLVALNSL